MDSRRLAQHNAGNDEDRRSFYRHNRTVKFSKGETIFLQGEDPKCIYCIKSGIVEQTNLTSDGNRQLISFLITGDILPLSFALAKTKKQCLIIPP